MRVPTHPTLIRRQLNSRLKQLTAQQPVLGARLVEVHRQCGKPRCQCCQGGPKHLAYQVNFAVAGRSSSVYVPKDLLKDVRSWIEEHRRLKRLLAEINTLTLALIRNHVRHRRRRQGRP